MGLASLLGDACYEMATALLPMFLLTMGLGAGAAAVLLGLIEGTSDATASLLKLLSGIHGDRLDHLKPWVVGYAITAVCTGALALATRWGGVLGLRVSAWIGKGVRGPDRDTLQSGAAGPAHQGRVFGFHRTMDTVGAIPGPLTAFALLPGLAIRGIFLVALAPGLLSCASFLLVRERRRSPRWEPMRR